MSSFTEERKQARMMTIPLDGEITQTKYNLMMGLTVVYGLAANIATCFLLQDHVRELAQHALGIIIAYVIGCIAGTIISTKSDNPVISFLGYNLIVVPMGVVLSIVVAAYGGMNDPIVLQAFAYTTIITFCMIGLSISFPNFFSKLGGLLFGALIGLILCEILMLILGVHQIVTAWIGAVIFSLYIGYDYWKAQQYPKTLDNAIDSAIDIYIDFICLFLRLLEILGNNSGSRSRR